MTMSNDLRSTVCAAEDLLPGGEMSAEPQPLRLLNRKPERALSVGPAKSDVRRRLFAFYRLQLTRVWTHLSEGIRRSSAGRAYGRHLHATICRTADRQQYVATFFLRNRPELQLICRLLGRKPLGSTVDLSVLACSKGAEVYSIAWAIRSARPDLQLRIHALDISQEIVEFAERGVYSRESLHVSRKWVTDQNLTNLDRVTWNTHLHQQTPIFERVSDAELHDLCEVAGDRASIRPWLRDGITWLCGDAGDPALVDRLGSQDIVVANRFLCHMQPVVAETTLRNIVRLVKPGGHLFVSGVDLDVRTRVARLMGWRSVPELLREVYEGDFSLLDGWPLGYWAQEPFNENRRDWKTRYASVFQIGEAQ